MGDTTEADGGAGEAGAVHVAVVHAPDGVVLVAAADCGERLHERLGDYVAAHAADRLWPDQASRVQGLLAEGRRAEAVEAYFGAVGGRWDEERLVTTVVPVNGRTPLA